MRNFSFLLFVIMTFVCWGLYGPVLHIGQDGMIGPGEEHLGKGSLRPFICVGVAYFLIAVLFPIFALSTRQESGSWSLTGIVWSFGAGAIGAIGALGIVLAFKFKGSPVYVMPLVFGCAPVVNTIVTMLMSKTIRNASLLFYVGVAVVAIGAAGVLSFKPTLKKSEAPETEQKETESETEQTNLLRNPAITPTSFTQDSDKQKDSDEPTNGNNDSPTQAPDDDSSKDASKDTAAADSKPADSQGNLFYVFLCILVTALCWGGYGPVLHKGQAKMGGSRLRPFLCVGMAYFAIAVVAPSFLLPYFEEPGWKLIGSFWSLLAGVAGAVGALGIIYAFNFGGKPIFVMPLVFGFAPVVNTFTEILTKGLIGEISQFFYLSLCLVIFGAVTVLVCAPRGKPPKQQQAEEPPEEEPTETESED